MKMEAIQHDSNIVEVSLLNDLIGLSERIDRAVRITHELEGQAYPVSLRAVCQIMQHPNGFLLNLLTGIIADVEGRDNNNFFTVNNGANLIKELQVFYYFTVNGFISDADKGKRKSNMETIEPDAMVLLSGTAIFKGERLKGYLDVDDTRILFVDPKQNQIHVCNHYMWRKQVHHCSYI